MTSRMTRTVAVLTDAGRSSSHCHSGSLLWTLSLASGVLHTIMMIIMTQIRLALCHGMIVTGQAQVTGPLAVLVSAI